jgi:hypothetical protein
MRMPSEAPFLRAAFSLRRRSSSAFVSSSDIAFPLRYHSRSMAASLWLLHTAASSADQRTKLDARDRITTRPPLINKSKHERLCSQLLGACHPRKLCMEPKIARCRSTRKSFRSWSAVSGGKRQEQSQIIATAIGRPTATAPPSMITISLSRP